jgi:2-polyprenyl-6-methoxyphenol hydroxylase-like FAD-dependent oxidoreductase
VVVGGSLAGLLAARVLSDHFDHVTVVERDALLDGSLAPRKGVPQGRQLHGLLKRGEDILEELFPGIMGSLRAAGAVSFDFGRDCFWYHFGGWKTRFPSGLVTTGASRPLVEAHVRSRVFALPNVERRDEWEVTGLAATADRARIAGVTARRHEGTGEMTISADLVVDASGRGSRLPLWLSGLGYQRPPETSVRVNVAYAGRVYREPSPSPYAWSMLYVIGDPVTSGRIGALLRIEGGRIIAILVGVGHDPPPTDPAGYLEFARSLPTGEVHRVLGELEPLTDVEVYRFPANLRRHYERLDRMPEGLVVVGDALASFNPVYGQGMSVAAMGAMELDASLSAQRRLRGPGRIEGLGARFHAAAAKVVDVPWTLATSEDFRSPATEGKRPLLYPAMKWYFGEVHRASLVDPEICGLFLRVMHLIDGPEKLLAPRTVLQVLRAARRSR